MSWHYVSKKGKEIASGEVDLSVLIDQGLITKDTEVWRDGLSSWIPAGEAAPGNFRSSKLRPNSAPPVDPSPVAPNNYQPTSGPKRDKAPSREKIREKEKMHASGVESVGFKDRAQKVLDRADKYDDETNVFVRPAIGMFCVVGYFIYLINSAFSKGKPPFFDSIIDMGLVIIMLVLCMFAAWVGWFLTRKFHYGTEIGFLLMFALILKSNFFGMKSYLEAFRPVSSEAAIPHKMLKMNEEIREVRPLWWQMAEIPFRESNTASKLEGKVAMQQVMTKYGQALDKHFELAEEMVEAKPFIGTGVSEEQMEKKAKLLADYQASALKMHRIWKEFNDRVIQQLRVNGGLDSTVGDVSHELDPWVRNGKPYGLGKELWANEVRYASALATFGELMKRTAGEWSYDQDEKLFSFRNSEARIALDAVVRKIKQTQINYSRSHLELLQAL